MEQNVNFPQVLPMRQRAEMIRRLLKKRLDNILPLAMRENGFDLWIILCQEDNLDPVFKTLIPMDTWCPILQVLVFYDRGSEAGIERINISGTDTHDLYDRPYRGQLEREQWPLLRKIVEERDPKRIGINIGSVQWASGGLTYNLYNQLIQNLPANSCLYKGRPASSLVESRSPRPAGLIWNSLPSFKSKFQIKRELKLFLQVCLKKC